MRFVASAVLVLAAGCAGRAPPREPSEHVGTTVRAPAPASVHVEPVSSRQGEQDVERIAFADAGAPSCPRTEHEISTELASLLDKVHDLVRAEHPEQALDDIEPARALAKELECYGTPAANAAGGKVEAWAARLTDWVQIEQKCRASAACMSQRVQLEICIMLSDEREILNALTTGQGPGANRLPPAQALRERLRNLRARIAAAKSHFRSVAHRPFNPKACPIFVQEI